MLTEQLDRQRPKLSTVPPVAKNCQATPRTRRPSTTMKLLVVFAACLLVSQGLAGISTVLCAHVCCVSLSVCSRLSIISTITGMFLRAVLNTRRLCCLRARLTADFFPPEIGAFQRLQSFQSLTDAVVDGPIVNTRAVMMKRKRRKRRRG